MANAFSNFGLAMRGSGEAQMDQERIRNARQYNDLDPQRRSAMEQQSQIAGQQIETGQMGLDDSRRSRAADAAARAAAQSNVAGGGTMSGSLLEMADSYAKQGAMDKAIAFRQAHAKLEEMGAPEVIHAAVTGPTGDRPDIVKIMNRYEATKGVDRAEIDPSGKLLTWSGGRPKPTVDLKILGERLGVFKAPTVHNIPAGGVGVVTGPGIDPTKPSSQIQTPKTFPEHPKEGYITRTEKDADGNEVQRIIDVRPNSPTYGQEVGPAAAGVGAGGTNVRKDLSVLNDITKGITELGDEYGKTDMSNPLNPKITLTPKGQQVALVAEQIRLANQNLAPRTIIEMAVKGKPMWKTENGQRSGVVLYNGQEFPMSTPAAKAVPVVQPRPEAALPNAPAAPVIPPVAPPVQAPPPKVSPVVAPGMKVPSTRTYDVALENTDTVLKRIGSTLRMGLKNSALDYQLWQSYVARAKQLGSKDFARGGKVKKQQRYGLG